MKNFESRFIAQVAKFNAIATTTKLPECITALMLMSNSSIDDAQRVSVMVAAALSAASLNAESTNDQYLRAVTYNAVASVIKQCDKSRFSGSGDHDNTLNASSGAFSNHPNKNRRNRNCDRSSISPTMKYPCNTCGKFGHWKRNHRADGTLAPGVKSFDHPQDSTSLTSNNDSATVHSSGSGTSAAASDKKRLFPSSMRTLAVPSLAPPLLNRYLIVAHPILPSVAGNSTYSQTILVFQPIRH